MRRKRNASARKYGLVDLTLRRRYSRTFTFWTAILMNAFLLHGTGYVSVVGMKEIYNSIYLDCNMIIFNIYQRLPSMYTYQCQSTITDKLQFRVPLYVTHKTRLWYVNLFIFIQYTNFLCQLENPIPNQHTYVYYIRLFGLTKTHRIHSSHNNS